jgi:hypothetical protein
MRLPTRFCSMVGVLILLLSSHALALDGFIGIRDGYFYDQSSGESWLPHGIAYQTWNRPLGVWQTYDQIDYDLDEMVKMGANSIRVDFVWKHIEEDGDNQWEWANYDYLVQACEERGIRIFALIGYQWPPDWFPDDCYTMHPPGLDDAGIMHTNRWQSDIINYEHPTARAQYAEWFSTVCARYKDSKAIAGWIIGNEYGYLGLWSLKYDGYDPYCEAAFRAWLSNRYGAIANLNATWGSSYGSFDEIVLVDEYAWKGPAGAEWADMVQWHEDSIAGFTAMGASAARNADTNHLLSYATVGMQWGEEDWRYHAEDRGKIARACAATNAPLAFFSINNYPWALDGHETRNGQWGVSYTKKIAGIPVLYTETGFTSSETLFPGLDENRQGRLIQNTLWEGLQAGAIGTHLFTWQDRPFISDREKGFGILYGDRRIKPGFWKTRDAFNLMDQINLTDLLAGSTDPKPDVAFLWTPATDSQYIRFENEMQHEAGALERLGYEPNFLTLEDLAADAYTNYRVVILPRNMRTETEVPGSGLSLLEFLSTEVIPAGVHVLAIADLPGMQDAWGKPRAEFAREVDDLFGIDPVDVGGYEPPGVMWESVLWGFYHPVTVEFLSAAPTRLAGLTCTPSVWKICDGVKVTDGTLWARMKRDRNRGFEDDDSAITNWNTWGNTAVRQWFANEGSNHIQVWEQSGVWQDFDNAIPGQPYVNRAYLRSNGDDPLRGGAYASATIEWYDRSNVLISIVSSDELRGSTPGDAWVEYTASGVAPATAAKGRRLLRVDYASTNLIANGALTGTGTAPEGWQAWNDSTHDPLTSLYRSASNSWVFWWDGGIYQDFTSGFKAGDTMEFGGYLYTPSSNPMRSGGKCGVIKLEFFNGDTSVGYAFATPSVNSASARDVWIYASGQATVPSGTTRARIVVCCADYSTGDGIFYADDIFAFNASYTPNLLANGELAASSSVFSVYRDSGLPANSTVYPWTGDWGCSTFNQWYSGGSAPEGSYCFLDSSCTWSGWGIFRTSGYEDLSAYSGGCLRFSLKSTQTLKIELEGPVGTKAAKYIGSTGGQWQDISIPLSELSAVNLAQINGYFLLSSDVAATSYVDNIRFTKEGGDAPIGWGQWYPDSHDSSTAVYRSGPNAWCLWWDGGIYQDVTNSIFVGDALTFGGFLYNPNTDVLRNGSKNGVIQLEFYNGSTFISSVSASPTINSGSPTNTWVYSEGSAVVPENATKARVVVRCSNYSSGDGTFVADDVFLKNVSNKGSVFIDGETYSPAVVAKDHGTAKAVMVLYAQEMCTDSDGDTQPDVMPWVWRSDVLGGIIEDYFGVNPSIKVTGDNAYLCLPEYRTCADGTVLMQIRNFGYDWQTGGGTGGAPQTFTLTSSLFSNKTVEAVERGEILERDCDGTLSMTMEPDGMEMLLVYDTNQVKQIVHVVDAPSSVHPFGDKAYLVTVDYDCLDAADLALHIAFMEDGDNGDGITNEVYQGLVTNVVGNGRVAYYLWIPDFNQADSDYISTPDGGRYCFRAWLEDSANNIVAESEPLVSQLKWGVRPADGMPTVMDKGDNYALPYEWEDLQEYLTWENTPIARNSSFPNRIAVFRSTKTEALVGGQFDKVNEVCDWLESLGYSGAPLDVVFDDVVVSNLFSDTFSDGNWDGWTRVAGAGNWDILDGALHSWRVGNDDNLLVAGASWTNYIVETKIKYRKQDPYFNDAELLFRYQDRGNYYKVGIQNFYGSWRLKYTVKVGGKVQAQGWLHNFTKLNHPVENTWYHLRVEAVDNDFTVYFNGEPAGSFTATNFASGRIGLCSRAMQLGIWEPQKGYYFIDDDEYGMSGAPLNLDWGYLQGFFPTLILPSTYVMSDTEVSNIWTWATNGLHCIIATDGGVGMLDETGAPDAERMTPLFGVPGVVTNLSAVTSVTVGGDGHYATLDYTAGACIPVSGSAKSWAVASAGKSLGTLAADGNWPALIAHIITNKSVAPSKVFTFNFGVDEGGQLTNQFSAVAQRALEWAQGEAYQMQAQLMYTANPTNPNQDIVLFTTNVWILAGSGTASLNLTVPTDGIMTGTNLYWSLFIYPWDGTNRWATHGGFYTSDNDPGYRTRINGMGLQILGIASNVYAGRAWDMWAAYNTDMQQAIATFGVKDKGVLTSEDNFNDGDYSGWTVVENSNIAWQVTGGALKASVTTNGGYAYITRNGVNLGVTNLTLEYNVRFMDGAAGGGVVYRGCVLYVNPTLCGWADDDENYITDDTGVTTGQWQHVVVSIRDGSPYLRSDLQVDGQVIFADEPIENTNITAGTIGFLSSYDQGYVEWDNFRVADEQYTLVSETVSGEVIATTGGNFWPAIPDYDPNWWEHEGTTLGGQYEWYVYLRGEGLHDYQDVNVYFAPRLMTEESTFPTSFMIGSTVEVPVEWECLGSNVPAYLCLSLENAWTGTRFATNVYLITNSTDSGAFEVAVPSNTPPGIGYVWAAFIYPTNAIDPWSERIGADDTFRRDADGFGVEPEVSITVTGAPLQDFVVYGDVGIPANSQIYTWGYSASFNGNYTNAPAEGQYCFRTVAPSWAGWGVFFPQGTINLSAYSNGYIKLYLKSQNWQVYKIELEGPPGTKVYKTWGHYSFPLDQWNALTIPVTNFAGIDLTQMYGVGAVSSFDYTDNCVDYIRWTLTP